MHKRINTGQYWIRSISSILLLMLMLFMLTSLGGNPANAQSGEDVWSQPLNLSQSGATSNPVTVIDATGVLHVIWLDKINGTMYTKRENGNWSSPTPVKPNFRDNKPTLVADSKGIIHAFWEDADDRLYYSHVASTDFASTRWGSLPLLAYPVLDFDVSVDSHDNLHLVYLQTRNTSVLPAGIYYRRSVNGGSTWSPEVLLYQSLYFRALTSTDAHVQIAVGNGNDNSNVYVVWDNRPRGKIFLAESADSGKTWAIPEEVDKPTEGGTGNPVNIQIGMDEGKILLIWQSGIGASNCDIYYTWSLDEGKTWQPRQQLAGRSLSCPRDIQILNRNEGLILLLMGDQTTLLAWDGTRWSNPQPQPQLNNFIDPETELNVNFGCQQAILVGGNELDVVGCDQSTNGDIWWMDRRIIDTSEWFPQGAIWDPPTTIARKDEKLLSLSLISDSEGRIYIFWSQTKDSKTLIPDTALYYIQQDEGNLWSQPAAILNSTNEIADKPTVVMSPDDRILVAWQRGDPGQIFFSQVAANLAVVPSDWSEPKQLSLSSQTAISPDLLVNRDGKIFVTYAVPANEGRGIYLSYSDDGGQIWSEPVQIFDAVAASWEMVDQPQLTFTNSGTLHILWKRYTFASGSPVPYSLLYANSNDDGIHWSKPEEVIAKPVEWSEIVGIGDSIVHCIWQESENDQSIVWDEQSLDNGRTWNRISINSVFGDISGNVSLASDTVGNLQLIQAAKTSEGNFELQNMQYDGQQWQREPSLNLNLESQDTINSLAALLLPSGNLEVIVDSRIIKKSLTGSIGSKQQDILFFTRRSIQLIKTAPSSMPSITPFPLPTQEPTLGPTSPPIPTPTIDLSSLNLNNEDGIMGNSYSGLIFGGLVAVVIVVISIVLGIWLKRGVQRR